MPEMSVDDLPFELRALASAEKYQKWVIESVHAKLGQRILEVGSGTGNMSRWLPVRERLVLTEGDDRLLAHLRLHTSLTTNPKVLIRKFDLDHDDPRELVAENIDTIVSFNVLEHVEDDTQALRKLKSVLLDGKGAYPRRLISFIPAQQWAYGSLDKAFGHHRRYSRRRWRKLHQEVAPEAQLTFRYFNPVGLLGWYLNGRILRKSEIGTGAMRAFERLLPLVRPLDRLMHGWLRMPTGQSLVAILEWPEAPR